MVEICMHVSVISLEEVDTDKWFRAISTNIVIHIFSWPRRENDRVSLGEAKMKVILSDPCNTQKVVRTLKSVASAVNSFQISRPTWRRHHNS